jgi:hypothetical protein
VYNIYAPLGLEGSQARMSMEASLVVGPSACNLVRGMDANPPKGLNKLMGPTRNEYVVEMSCPDLQDQGKVTFNTVSHNIEYTFCLFVNSAIL